MIRSGLLIAGLLILAPAMAVAQGAADASLDETQQLGRRLYGNHCVVCHEKPQITSIQFGPSLSRETAGGREDVVRDVISNGTPRMPGFKHQFTPTQIAAIAAYLKTLPAPPPPAPAANAPR
jgi:mono/diheme cytochrome c family protein